MSWFAGSWRIAWFERARSGGRLRVRAACGEEASIASDGGEVAREHLDIPDRVEAETVVVSALHGLALEGLASVTRDQNDAALDVARPEGLGHVAHDESLLPVFRCKISLGEGEHRDGPVDLARVRLRDALRGTQSRDGAGRHVHPQDGGRVAEKEDRGVVDEACPEQER